MLRLLLDLLLVISGGDTEIGYSTQFAQVNRTTGKRDKHAGGASPCIRRLVRPTDNLIAHRTLPCGTKVRLTNLRTGKTTMTKVGERGPYGACTAEGWALGTPCPPGFWQVKKKEEDEGEWRGSFDLTPRVGRALKHNGFELVMLEVVNERTESQDQGRVALR